MLKIINCVYHTVVTRSAGIPEKFAFGISRSYGIPQLAVIPDKAVCENEIADGLAKTGAKKARHLPCEMTATKEEIKKVNKKLTLQKWGRRWQNTKSNMYKILIPNLTSDGLKQRALL